ncbi:thyrostimulin beta-5 subunit [Coccinella septempunctata]|uniref:thyrostimulin beta-5 subunit n=1 Tax=Coccinella septempunctata TaxID=41139 RepID=UPI001D07E3E2|nr:thyrostimulin beta-5 subunit [Coccinella septempunctata]
MQYLISWNICLFMITTSVVSQIDVDSLIPPEEDLECRERVYTFQVTQTDENGKQCWDALSTVACWGRCDSNEISDWRFPFKKSNHPVCIHYGRNRNVVTLRHCEEGALPEAARYEYLEAAGCKCQICSSSDTSCEGLRYRPQRSHPQSLGFQLI